jgi:FrsA-like alpha/beta hydrolase family protein
MSCLASAETHAVDYGRWMQWSDHEEHRLEFARILSAVEAGGSTVLECFMTADRIIPGDDDSWHREWQNTAEASRTRAERAAAAGHKATARSNWMRASNYFRAAEVFLTFADARRESTLEQMRLCSRRYLQHLELPGEVVTIPSIDGGVMEGYLLRASGSPAKMSVVVCVGGWDDFKDEYLFKLPRHALDRGLSLLLVEFPKVNPAQRRKMFGRFDIASSLGNCVDYLIERGDVDQRKIAIYGEGPGASFATDAAALDSRFSAAVCDGGMSDLRRRAFAMQQLLDVKGGHSIKSYLDKLKHHSLAKQIRCPVLVTVDEGKWLDAIHANDDARAHSAATNGLRRIFGAGDIAVPDVKSYGAPMAYECVFDWIANRVTEAGNAIIHRIGEHS